MCYRYVILGWQSGHSLLQPRQQLENDVEQLSIWHQRCTKILARLELLRMTFTVSASFYGNSYQKRNLLNMVTILCISLDLMFAYKVIFNLVDVNRDEFFTVRINHSRRDIAINCMCLMAKLLLDTIISAIESVVFEILFHLMMLILSQCIDFVIV